jgi:hypothetical protein
MAKVFDTWTVLPHRPLEKLTDNLWTVEGTMPDGKTTRVMSLARLRDGRVVVHNGIALEEPLMKEIEAWGTPSFIAVPNGFHRQDARIYKQRYPNAKVLAPRGSAKKVGAVVAVDGTYDDAPKDEDVRMAHLDGCKEVEGMMEVRSKDGATLIFNDVLCNMPQMGGVIGFMLAPTGTASVPRVMRWLAVKQKGAFKGHLERLASTPDLKRIIVAHGSIIGAAPGQTLKTAAAAV